MAKTITDILVTKNTLTLDEASLVKKDAKEKGVSVEDLLYQRGITEGDVAQAKSELTGYSVKTLGGVPIPLDVLRDIPEESARHYKMIPLGRREGYIEIGMLNPDDVTAQEALKFIAARINLPARIYIIIPSDFQSVLSEYRSLSGEVTKALGEFEKEYEELAAEVKIRRDEPAKIVEEAPVTKMVAVILRHAVEGRASDVHIEPSRKELRVRFRVDGTLHTSLMLPLDVHPAVISRIKVMSNLKIDETRVPQDGRFHAEIIGRDIDFRVSSFPTAFGEKVAIRILDPEAGIKTFPELGLSGRNLALLEENIKRPFGMILITGPTGSGKSTTLYAILQILNQEKSNIVSLEDPIEYFIPGVNQSQIKPEIGYDFATGLRHILRQDPDIIMVGEIRDKETAALAIHAALTGHLVLSTLHTNNAVGVIPRLIDMGVDPFLIPPTLILAAAQRLVRKLCPDSRKKIKLSGKIKDMVTRETEEAPAETREEIKKINASEIYQAETSPTCPKGTSGRTGIFEILSMTPELEKIILTSPSESKILEEAKRQGTSTMKQDGLVKVLKGIISLEDLLEVV
ncbi:MAG: type II/IV secretion system protein [Candidatus Sungiibacteriota bacterium]|uniref:Type II/IV secretion system protein n=1 Tax=Candidatus Sungiibacteriota bacterium TaxID=2750080 RepID=A0A7T5UQZ3_9BACT|nr:MAG: type II/IV secretion system protein [Candidatus Sungbacteria bacterium]